MNAKIDTIRDCFLKFLADGMTHSDALAELRKDLADYFSQRSDLPNACLSHGEGEKRP